MKALVTGSAGFVGRHLCAHLEDHGDTVVGVDRADGPDLLDARGRGGHPRRGRPDVVYHLGGWSDVGASWEHPIDAFQVNAAGTLNLLQACSADGVPRVLAVSSADVYGRVSPTSCPSPRTPPSDRSRPYAASKIAADQLALQAWLGLRARRAPGAGVQPPRPRPDHGFVAPALAERIALNERDGSDVVPVGNLTPAATSPTSATSCGPTACS